VQVEALCTVGVLVGDQTVEERVAVLSRAVELAESAGMLDQAARAHNNLGVVLFNDGWAAREHFLRAAELARQRGEVAQELFFALNATHSALWLAEFALVEQEIQSHRELLDDSHGASTAANTILELEALLLRYRGELAEAIDRLRALHSEARAAGDLQKLSGFLLHLALAYVLDEVGETQEVEGTLQEALELGERGWPTAVSARYLLSLRRSRQGRAQEACQLLAEARLKAAEFGGAAAWEEWLGWSEAELAMAEGRWPEALAAYQSAADVMRRRGLRWFRARTLCEWAGAHLARGEPGDRQQAEALLREAEAEFAAMGAPIYGAQVRKQLAELGTD
jgi:tetratricopeptide (TPR) repeat protein